MKTNEFSESFNNENELDNIYIEFAYVPSLNNVYFGYKNEKGENGVCNLEYFDGEYITDEIKIEQLKTIPFEKKYTINEFSVLFSEEELEKNKIIRDFENELFYYWRYSFDKREKHANILYMICCDNLNIVYF